MHCRNALVYLLTYNQIHKPLNWFVLCMCVIGYVGGTASFQDVINKSTTDLFCAATPNPDAGQVKNTSMLDPQLLVMAR